MKILSAKQLAEADKISIKKQGITSEELMERAASLVFEEIHHRLENRPIPIKIFCGIGNNGGDGLVIARKLMEHDYKVKVYIVNYSNKRSEDFLSNYDKLKALSKGWPVQLKGENDLPELNKGDFVVDSIFGIGLNRPIEGWMAKLVNHINQSGAFILSVDMPSGLFPDQAQEKNAAIVKADYTLSFQAPKIAFFLPETMDYVGNLQILDIGLDREFIGTLESNHFLITSEYARAIYKTRNKNTHKGDYGNVLIAGGSYGKIGSVMLTATAALRTGTGLCSLFIPECGYEIIQTGLPEAMVLTDSDSKMITEFPVEFEADAICFGMGVGTDEKSISALRNMLEHTRNPVVIDADGLNILSMKNELMELLPENSILTPHPGELKRLIGEWKDDFEMLDKVKAFSKKYKVILVVKGAHTCTVQNDSVMINNSGNPGMATAGSGDVLSGVITSLLGQSYEPISAAVLAVYLHGAAGDIAAKEFGFESLLARDIANNIGRAIRQLFNEP
ncbi:NAD(P)H-hydrate dehydratase [Gramella sp. GC03-9]|uniref:Bifunctional NAD(P)H-hydrate repair enzyme n=1 Tax=Christiangramia oceanisediminis TaxID=2920386 RepID=A0A9X2RB90_9FLAO|nr:NAD(P)H-hydrate dehydratase [Gramella oceanisediminis]MCP9200335.1 NAD(P)H-hydrate dehydratase [Gramella oceanisediminis]